MDTIGYVLYSLIFLASGVGHLTKTDAMAGYAAHKGIPSPKLAVQISGLVIIVGAVALIAGQVKLGALLLGAFSLSAAILMHAFWKESDAMAKMNEQTAFLKNLALAGAALVFFVLAK
jgi:uncharacterized membrane protein YphA (DoxX/SURF4 family)